MSRQTRLAVIMARRPELPQYMWGTLFRMDPIVVSRYRRGLKEIRHDHLQQICEALALQGLPATPEDVLGWDEEE